MCAGQPPARQLDSSAGPRLVARPAPSSRQARHQPIGGSPLAAGALQRGWQKFSECVRLTVCLCASASVLCFVFGLVFSVLCFVLRQTTSNQQPIVVEESSLSLSWRATDTETVRAECPEDRAESRESRGQRLETREQRV